ncbi:MAG: segregation/condensation protein A [Rhodospirillaceae bacterium]|jgi:segregation and condensation protein A|nr:segregation/condensation protein A [Rhodospirillaceae bacterium]
MSDTIDTTDTEAFEEGQAFETPSEQSGAAFVVDLEGFEGPIDVLLSLARDQKLDITQISMVALAEQYLLFVAEARRRNLELAADYLVMAAWLAYMKSRLLLPDMGDEDEPSGEEMAAALAFQLKRLQAMKDASEKLLARTHLGIDFFGRGEPEVFRRTFNTIYDASLFDLLKAYGEQRRRKESGGPLHIEAFEIYTVEDALVRLRRLLGPIPEWKSLWGFLPDDLRDGLILRSAVASTFAASLEMAKEGRLKLQQAEAFAPIHIRSSKPSGEPANDDENGNDA